MANQRITHNKKQSQDWQAFYDEFANNIGEGPHYDRTVAILGAAFMEERVKELLEHFFIDHKASSDLLNEELAFGYSVKIRTAFVLGLIGEGTYSDLKLIGAVRNIFAHDLQQRHFTDDDIKSRCAQLTSCDIVEPESGGPRRRFIATTVLLSSQIAVMALGVRDWEKRKKGKDFTLGGILRV